MPAPYETRLDRILARRPAPKLDGPEATQGIVRERGLFAAIKPPTAGHVLVVRKPRATRIQVVYPDGQSESLAIDRHFEPLVVSRGIPYDKMDRAVQYAWNFGAAYVFVGDALKPPVAKVK